MIDTKYASVVGPIFVGHRSFFLWEPTIIGSQSKLALSDWLLSVLQTEDQWKGTDNFVSIISVYTSDEEEWRDGEERSGAEIASVIGNLLHEAGQDARPLPCHSILFLQQQVA